MKTKKFLFTAIAAAIALSSFAQSNTFSGGLVLGANYSYLNSNDELNTNYDWKWKFGPVGGIYLNIPFGDAVGIQPSALYSQMGARYYFTDNTGSYKLTQNLGYISVPVPLKINAGNSLAFLVGPQFDFLAGASLKDASDHKIKNEDNFEQFDLGLTGGIQFMPNSPVSLTVRYMHGLKNLMNGSSSSSPNEITTSVTNTHNSGVQASLNLRLFGGKRKSVAVTTPEIPQTLDSDNDGVNDSADKCPNTPGVAKYNGCPVPDSDKDGVNDDDDKCPTVAGVAKYAGCPVPDSDNDGINDDNDKCPSVPGVERYEGCPVPDSDNDGINDEEDNCPNLPGSATNHGCPEMDKGVQNKVDMMAKHITWSSSNGYTLSSSSNKALDQVANMLMGDSSLKVTVAAYTSNAGDADENKTLSQNRADAVKNYLVNKGVDENQIEATGYGEEQPIANNNTAAGRAKNQRVELKLHY
jgi:outer membrane protein OmpA-like peptidoglycan-associated protein